MAYIPDRRDVVWLSFDPKKGREQTGRRPALIISSKIYNAKSFLALCCPITSRVKGYPFEVEVQQGNEVKGVVLVDQLQSVDWKARGADFIVKLDQEYFEEVIQKILALVYLESE